MKVGELFFLIFTDYGELAMKKHGIWLVALGIGVVNALLLHGFELAVNNGTDQIWNDLFRSNTYRWVVIPLAVGLGVLFTLVVRWLHEERLPKPELDLLSEMRVSSATLASIGVILAIGLVSLLAGASLGPEAPLMASSAAIGAWAADRSKLSPNTQLLVQASVGALLVAFLASLFMLLLPLLMLAKAKQFKPVPVGITILAGVVSFGVLHLVDPTNPGFNPTPPLPQAQAGDYIVALVAGFVTTALAFGLNYAIMLFWKGTDPIGKRLRWITAAAAFGLVLGICYWLGGQSLEFSGDAGAKMLNANSAHYGAAALAGLVFAKLIATAWSKASGYRGGLVFPSIYIGVALGLLIGHLNSGWAGAGASVGSIAGMLSSVTASPVVAAIFVVAILPVGLLPVALVAIVGSGLGSILLKRLTPQRARPET